MFFSFDGIDGAGKSTQVERFCRWLRGLGRDVVACRDPGSTPLGEQVRRLVLEPGGAAIGGRAEMLLYMAARAQLVEETIAPALQASRAVVCDRFLLANVVYQGHAGGLPVEEVRRVGEVAVAGTLPDVIFLLDLDPADALERIRRGLDRMEQRGADYLGRVRDGFLAEARRDPQRIALIDARRDAESVEQEIRAIARERFPSLAADQPVEERS